MLFRSVALITASTAAVASGKSVEVPMNDISANTKLGGNIMSKARRLEDNGEAGAWVANYSIVFQKCAVSNEYFAFEGENQDQNNWQVKQKLVHFKLCPTANTGSCKSGADYVVPMNDFVEMYLQSKMDAQEYNCEMVKENCYCENANDDEACETQCYVDAGLDYCEEDNQNNNNNNQAYEFDIEEAGRCEKMDVDEDTLYYYLQQNGGNNYNVYGNNQGEVGLYIGPQCSSNGKSIFLNVFMDEWCSIEAPRGAFSNFAYGQTLPYSSTSIIENNSISCKEPQDANDQNNGDYQDEDEILEVCERLYEEAAKCESSLPTGTTYYPNSYGCNLVKSLKSPGKSGKGTSSTAKVFASLFAVCAIGFAGAAYYFHQKSQRANVALVDESGAGEGTMA
eukprot:CAMPEP_0201713790 /NCGR_PEP_ID=MMETSP0593-20130828/503_1 /ASSEMBLY_ACC=CAM_ASM_000672 /TAXON_ID=267983 /ORGANISM="Skeletonema japonicum, Strain CCMP2506" /LENGTH=394 /DNA_ID=CAMNT_0048202977 /DNA_START=41 /DNA_END=1225 /DNA_ORIENTATION=+